MLMGIKMQILMQNEGILKLASTYRNSLENLSIKIPQLEGHEGSENTGKVYIDTITYMSL